MKRFDYVVLFAIGCLMSYALAGSGQDRPPVAEKPQQPPVHNPTSLTKDGVVTFKEVRAERVTIGDGITLMTAANGTSGIWITNPKTDGLISIYLTSDQGPCIGIHRNRKLTGPSGGLDGYDLALSAKGGEPIVQFRKRDGTFGYVAARELEAMQAPRVPLPPPSKGPQADCPADCPCGCSAGGHCSCRGR